MTFWFLLALMTGAAVFAVLWPLSRRPQPVSAGHDVRVYRDQLDEIARDQAAGRIGETEAEAARVEVSRRLLSAADQAGVAPSAPTPPSRRRAVAVAALVALPLLSLGLYLALGSPRLVGQPPFSQAVAQMEAYLQTNPQDGRGWELLAPVYMQLGRYEDSARARRNALTYNGATATRESDLGEALVAASGGVVTAEALQAFERAVALDAREVKARYFLGVAAQQQGRLAEAATIFRELLNSAPAGASWAEFVREELERIEPGTSRARGPSADDMAAAARMDPQQRQQMISGMVEGLAEKLKEDGSDFEGWMRLVRAYTVLGEREKARGAATDARRAAGGDNDKLRRLDALIKELGLEG